MKRQAIGNQHPRTCLYSQLLRNGPSERVVIVYKQTDVCLSLHITELQFDRSRSDKYYLRFAWLKMRLLLYYVGKSVLRRVPIATTDIDGGKTIFFNSST